MTRIDIVPKLALRARDAHKGSFGTVLVAAGSQGMLGAAILVARAALRGGAGLVRAALPHDLMNAFTVAVPPATTVDRDDSSVASLCVGVAAIVVGPGLGASEDTRRFVDTLLLARGTTPVVLDADALNVLAPWTDGRRVAPAVMTPHPGEAARLLATSVAHVQRAREAAALALASRRGTTVVLKGAGTIVTDGERVFVNTTGNPGLATGGSGDVLAGLLGALLAQGLSPFEAARLAVHVHGAAGDRVAAQLSEPGLCADDLPVAIAAELARFIGPAKSIEP
ncbi:MAG: NAD(P)H-hydrate dehydratase [Planctomycetes bacterium]|nr:NAD(P)H-hydrate dehydratase [Planctomycetota bacterium]